MKVTEKNRRIRGKIVLPFAPQEVIHQETLLPGSHQHDLGGPGSLWGRFWSKPPGSSEEGLRLRSWAMA
jgi:hypothetical protein